ncbi:MAG: CotH kinase family protein [Clostridiales bacterium]|nr:CotH kinase family protein [Clostridiales bacterium]
MKTSRTICRPILPLLFAVLLAAGILVFVFSRNPAHDDIAEDILRFDLLSGEETAAQVCSWSGNGTDFFLFLPSFADPDKIVFAPLHNTQLALNGRVFQKGDRLSSLSSDEKYDMTISGHSSEHLTFSVMRASNIPSLFVVNSSRAMEKVHADKNHKEKASVVLLTENGTAEYEGVGLDEIKGRGNSSWNLDKKPYHLTLSAAVPLLGMNSSRHWVLLSNGWDRTSLRNKLVYDFAGKTSLPWTPECRYVDLFVNGTYNGLYLLSEQAEFDAGRISPSDPGNSFLAEITQLRKIGEHDHFFRTESGRCFKIVEPEKYKDKRYSSICQALQRTEDAILSLTEDGEWPDFLDLDSFVRRYLIDEVFLNFDSDSSSSYYYWDASAQKMFAYPVWDYDLSCGNPSHDIADRSSFPEQLFAKNAPYYKKMYANRIFFQRMTELYKTEFLPLYESLMEKDLPDLEAVAALSSSMNTKRWADMYRKMRDGAESDSLKIAELLSFLLKRDAFLRSAWIDGTEYCTVVLHEIDGRINIVFSVESGAKASSVPSPKSFGIADSDQWYPAKTDTPIDPETMLADNLSLYPLPHTSRTEIIEQQRKSSSEVPNKAAGPVDYIVRLIRHDGEIVIPLFILILILAAMFLYILLNSSKTGGRRK